MRGSRAGNPNNVVALGKRDGSTLGPIAAKGDHRLGFAFNKVKDKTESDEDSNSDGGNEAGLGNDGRRRAKDANTDIIMKADRGNGDGAINRMVKVGDKVIGLKGRREPFENN